MRKLSVEKQQAIIQGYNRGLSIRMVASVIKCSPITARTYVKLNSRARTISEGMIIYHQLKRGKSTQTLDMMLEYYNIPPIVKSVLPCGKTRNDCVNCKDIFSDKCEDAKQNA